MRHYKKIAMYYTFKEAAEQLGIHEYNNYQYVRIDRLVNQGRLEEVYPDFYVFDGNKYRQIDIKTERLVSADSVHKLVLCNGKSIIAEVVVSGEKLTFCSIKLCAEHFGITRTRLRKPLQMGKTIEINGQKIRFKYL